MIVIIKFQKGKTLGEILYETSTKEIRDEFREKEKRVKEGWYVVLTYMIVS